MTILQAIVDWSKTLPAWQQDAVARLYADRTLSPADLDDLYALAKSEAGIEDPLAREPRVLADAEVAPPVGADRTVVLTGIKDLINVNALMNGAHLPIAPVGLTVVYGENGAGKSGYSRVFKKACRARDRREPILGNANSPDSSGRPAQATFTIIHGDDPIELAWNATLDPPALLSEIAIFDSHCARAYIDNQGDFAYAPYGLDILEGLVSACTSLRARAAAEKAAHTPSQAAYATLMEGQTDVARVLRGIPGTTKAEHIEDLASLSDIERQRLALLTTTLAVADPRQQAAGLRQKASRFVTLRQNITQALAHLSPAKVTELSDRIGRSAVAKAAADLAAMQFKTTPGQLPGTGDEAWKALFEAARTFVQAHQPDAAFPPLAADAPCPLCQNPLQDVGVQRLQHFDQFIQAAAETAAKTAREAAITAFRAMQAASVELQFSDALKEELAEVSGDLATACTALQATLRARHAAILEAAAGKAGWDTIPDLPDDLQERLAEIVAGIEEQLVIFMASVDETARAAMTLEHAQLVARSRLAEVKTAVLEALDKHAFCAKLQRCSEGMETRGISRKSTDLSRTIASQELADALNAELKYLKVHTLNVVMKPESPGGRTQFKLTLEVPGGGAPAAVLSEGEQRAIALASFLAEVRLAGSRGALVFDDPVSSLDHRRRWEVAQRLADEARMRQVIVFTHDIYFLLILEQKAAEMGAAITQNYIRKTAAGYGVYSAELPFDVLKTKDRLGRLRDKLVAIRRAAKDGDEERQRQLTTHWYGQLRLAWERCVEEVLLNGAVERFGEGISTQRLKGVTVTDEDYQRIEAGMSKSSKFEHDAASAVGRLPIPDPDELAVDVEQLATWREAINARVRDVAAGKTARATFFIA